MRLSLGVSLGWGVAFVVGRILIIISVSTKLVCLFLSLVKLLVVEVLSFNLVRRLGSWQRVLAWLRLVDSLLLVVLLTSLTHALQVEMVQHISLLFLGLCLLLLLLVLLLLLEIVCLNLVYVYLNILLRLHQIHYVLLNLSLVTSLVLLHLGLLKLILDVLVLHAQVIELLLAPLMDLLECLLLLLSNFLRLLFLQVVSFSAHWLHVLLVLELLSMWLFFLIGFRFSLVGVLLVAVVQEVLEVPDLLDAQLVHVQLNGGLVWIVVLHRIAAIVVDGLVLCRTDDHA